jgi:hypothetical protein
VSADLRTVTFAERPQLRDEAVVIGADVWPEYNRHGDVVGRLWGRLSRELPQFQFALLDGAGDVVALGWTLPCRWDGTADGLPAGLDGVFEAAFTPDGGVAEPDTLCAVAAEVPPERRLGGLSGRILVEMRELAARHGFGSLIAPVRPNWKARYPLAPIERYATWTRSDGMPFDPWIRLHVRLGAEILRPEPQSLRITAPVADWEQWTGLALPESGQYVFPEGLAPLSVDCEAGVASYWEPNVWVRHAGSTPPSRAAAARVSAR